MTPSSVISNTVASLRRYVVERWRGAIPLVPALIAALVLWLTVLIIPALYLGTLAGAPPWLIALPAFCALWAVWFGDVQLLTWVHLLAYVPAFVAAPRYLEAPLQGGVHALLTAALSLLFVVCCWIAAGQRDLKRLLRLDLCDVLGLTWLAMAWLSAAHRPSRVAVAAVSWLSVRLWPLAEVGVDRRWSVTGGAICAVLWWGWL